MQASRSTDPYRLAFLCSGDAMLLLDGAARVEAMNPAAERLVARGAAEARGAAVDDLLRPSMPLADLIAAALRARLGAPLPEGTALELAPSGHVEVEGRFDPLRDPEGDGDEGDGGGLLVLRDVSDRRAEERALREREARFRDAIESVRAGVALFGPDDRLVHENAICSQLFPLDQQGTPLGTSLPDVLRTVYRWGGTRPDVSEEEFVRTRLADFHGGDSSRTIRVLNRWIRVDTSRTADGCTVIMHTDVTALKEAEAAIEREKAFIRTILDSDPNPILVKETSGEVVFANRACADLLGVKAEAIVGKPTNPVVGPEIAAQTAAMAQQILGSMQAVTFTHEYRCPDGEVRWFTSTRMPLTLPGAPVRIFSVSVDVTESRRHAEVLNATIAELERQKREIADKLAVIEEQQALIRELSTPILQVAEGVLAVPVIGAMSDARAAEITSKLLAELARARARFAILDVTGVAAMDGAIAAAFVRMASAVALLGARAVLTGIQPSVAQAIASLGVDLRGVITCGNLRAGLELCLRARGGGERTGARSSSAR